MQFTNEMKYNVESIKNFTRQSFFPQNIIIIGMRIKNGAKIINKKIKQKIV